MKEILKQGVISKLAGGDTNHTFLLQYENKKYILRKFSNEATADYYVKLCKRLYKYGFLPKVYYKSGKEVIFEYINGRDCKDEDASKVAFQIGKICGIINRINSKDKYDPDKRFFSYTKDLRKNNLLTKKEAFIVNKTYNLLKKKNKPVIKMDANDVYPQNFRIRKGKVYLVDIEAMKPMFKGFGVAKSFIKWFKKSNKQEEVKRGYKSINPINFLTSEYLTFLYLNYLMRSIAIKIRLKIELNYKHIKKLKLLINESKK